jgi:perosamine synthetase
MSTIGIERGDEVIISASTNIATAIAVVLQGGVVVPVDSDPETGCMNPNLVEELITKKTKAIIPVHLFGHPVDMDPIQKLASDYNLYIVEDAAEAHGAFYKDRPVGSLGDMACFSFYANKIITTGEGGMIVTNDEKLAKRAALLRNLAFIEPRFYHEALGFNYRMTNLQAAIGCAQLERVHDTINAKRSLARRYNERLTNFPGLYCPRQASWAYNVYWMYAIRIKEDDFRASRDELMEFLSARGVETRTMFCPMNLQPALLNKKAVKPISCPVAEAMWTDGLYLPSSIRLVTADIDYVCDSIKGTIPCHSMSTS